MSYRILAPRIFTGNDEKYIDNGYVEIDGERIVKVGIIDELTEKEKEESTYYGESTILPGLINAHEHLATKSKYTSWTLDEIKAEEIPLQTIRAVKNAYGLLMDGVTTIRECGGRERINLSVSKAVKRGFIDGPDIIACGRPISITGGHCTYYSWQVDSPEEVVHAVRTEIKAGADFIKIHATGGAGSLEGDPRFAELSFEEISTAVKEAHRVHKRVASHSIGYDGIKNSVDAGVDTIEHGQYLDEKLLEKMAKQGTYYVPTLAGYVPLAERGLEMGRPVWMVEKAKKLVEKHREAVALARKYPEITIAAGTDSSGEIVEELELFVNNGYTTKEAIKFATKNAAKVLNIYNNVGTIEAGKKANIIVVKGDPIKKISDLRNLVQIIKAGKLIKKN